MRVFFVAALSFVLSVTAAEALTVRDLIELSRAGLGDDVLLALIDVDRGVYAIDKETIKALKDAGVSDRVIVALVRSGRETLPPPPPAPAVVTEVAPPHPQVVVIDRHEAPAREVVVPVPVYVPVQNYRTRYRQEVSVSPASSTYVPFQSGPPVTRPQPEPQRAPVYWGFGGKLRPDAWQPDTHRQEQPERKSDGKKDK